VIFALPFPLSSYFPHSPFLFYYFFLSYFSIVPKLSPTSLIHPADFISPSLFFSSPDSLPFPSHITLSSSHPPIKANKTRFVAFSLKTYAHVWNFLWSHRWKIARRWRCSSRPPMPLLARCNSSRIRGFGSIRSSDDVMRNWLGIETQEFRGGVWVSAKEVVEVEVVARREALVGLEPVQPVGTWLGSCHRTEHCRLGRIWLVGWTEVWFGIEPLIIVVGDGEKFGGVLFSWQIF
jgi:hypothetical protein